MVYLSQDITIMVTNIAFTLFLIPMIRKPDKPPLKSSGLTSIGIYLLAVSFATIGLWLGAVATTLNAMAWSILFIQGVTKRRR